jgi:hypothetical protein
MNLEKLKHIPKENDEEKSRKKKPPPKHPQSDLSCNEKKNG